MKTLIVLLNTMVIIGGVIWALVITLGVLMMDSADHDLNGAALFVFWAMLALVPPGIAVALVNMLKEMTQKNTAAE